MQIWLFRACYCLRSSIQGRQSNSSTFFKFTRLTFVCILPRWAVAHPGLHVDSGLPWVLKQTCKTLTSLSYLNLIFFICLFVLLQLFIFIDTSTGLGFRVLFPQFRSRTPVTNNSSPRDLNQEPPRLHHVLPFQGRTAQTSQTMKHTSFAPFAGIFGSQSNSNFQCYSKYVTKWQSR